MRLNLGCGNDIRKGWINLDIFDNEGVDVVHNLNELPLPFEDEMFDVILCKDILEHVNYIPLMGELHRILKEGGLIKIKVPHFTSKSNHIDPTHINTFSYRTFHYFVDDDDIFTYNKAVKKFSEIKKKIRFEQYKIFLLRFLNSYLEYWVNKCARHQSFYERSFLRIFPAFSLEVILKK